MLNEEQQEAVMHVNGPCLVTACPGSGKTRVIVHRAFNMINSGISPSNILMLTFTNKSAKEMKSRLVEMLKQPEISSKITCCTFHSLCVRILKRYYDRCGLHKNFNIADEDDCLLVLQSVLDNHHIKMEKDDMKFFIRTVNSHRENDDINLDRLDDWFYEDKSLNNFIKEYFESLKTSGNIDFTGLLHDAYTLLRDNVDVKDFINSKFKFVMVDEVQDTNLLQFELLKLIASHNNLFMVGDLDQSIYKFRGARPENMSKFCEEKEARLIKLSTNYRCGPNIIKLANQVISNNKGRINNQIIGVKTKGADVSKIIAMSRDDEAALVASRIKDLIEIGFPMREIAILFRTNHISRSFELSCSRMGIPYEVVGAYKFFDREEIRDIISMLKFLNNPADTMSLFRFINKPKRGIGPKMFGKFLDDYKSSPQVRSDDFAKIYKVVDLFSSFKNLDKISECIEFVLSSNDYRNYLKTTHPDSYEDRLDNILELKNSCIPFDNNPNSNLGTWLLNLMLMDTQDGENANSKIKLMSMHASKGLEFDCVFIVGLEDGVCPHKRSIQEDPFNLDEERRLLYVAITRSREALCLSCSVITDFRTKQKNIPSRFLIESGFIDLNEYHEEVSRLTSDSKR